MEERFTYDMLDRLTGVVEGLDTTGVFAYDAYGHMTSKYLHGEMVFDSTAYWASGKLQRPPDGQHVALPYYPNYAVPNTYTFSLKW